MSEREREREGGHAHITWKLRHINVQMFPGRQLSKNAQNLSSGYTANKTKIHIYIAPISISSTTQSTHGR